MNIQPFTTEQQRRLFAEDVAVVESHIAAGHYHLARVLPSEVILLCGGPTRSRPSPDLSGWGDVRRNVWGNLSKSIFCLHCQERALELLAALPPPVSDTEILDWLEENPRRLFRASGPFGAVEPGTWMFNTGDGYDHRPDLREAVIEAMKGTQS